MAQAQWIAFIAASYAHGMDDLPEAWFRAVYQDESAAFDAMVAYNNARDMARTRRKMAQERAGIKTRSLF